MNERAWVAIILATGLVTAIVLVTAGVLYDAIRSQGPGLSSNATTLLTTAFGGIIGVLGSYVGYKAGTDNGGSTVTPNEPDQTAGDEGVDDAAHGEGIAEPDNHHEGDAGEAGADDE